MAKYISTFNPQTGEYGATSDPFLMKMFREAIEIAGTGISPISLGMGKAATKQVPQGQMKAAPAPVAAPSPALAGSIQ